MARNKKPVSKKVTNTVAKYNYRLKAMGEQGVDVEYIKGKFEKANIPLTKSGNISTKGLTEQNIHALEAILPEMKSKGEYDYKDFAKQIEEEKSYNERRLAELQKTVSEIRYKEAMKTRVEEMLAEYYTDEGNSRDGGQFNSKFKSLPVYLQDKIESEMRELGRQIAKGELDPDTFDSYLAEWASYFD